METSLIQSDPKVMMGKPVIAGTRITVESVLEKLAAGETAEQLLEAHPRLTQESIFAASALASQSPLTEQEIDQLVIDQADVDAAWEEPVGCDQNGEVHDLSAVLTSAPEGGYIAHNPEMGTTTRDETVEEALANLREATELYLEEFPPTLHEE